MTTHGKTRKQMKTYRRRTESGFTAIEVAMVATVIAIFALLVLPIFRNRVEEAKIAAAKADLASLMKAQQLAKADTSFYFRLEDLDNLQNNAPVTPPANGITLETPPLVYFDNFDNRSPRGLTQNEWRALAGSQATPKFKGPYITMNNTAFYQDLLIQAPVLFRSNFGNGYAAIRDLRQGNLPFGSDPQLFDSPLNRFPLDPWGNPYLFFPPLPETGYNFAAIYCLGPDGLPGDGGGSFNLNDPAVWTREGANFNDPLDDLLGTGDDLKVQF